MSRPSLLRNEELRAAVELALRVPAGEPLPPTAVVIKAAGPVIEKLIQTAAEEGYAEATDRWSDLVVELRRMIDIMARMRSQLDGNGALLEAAALVASRNCESFTTGTGTCCRDGTDRYAYTTGRRWCDPCTMWAAVNGVPLSAAGTSGGEAR